MAILAKPSILKPLDDKIVIQLIESPNITPGGIHLPDTAKERPRRGRVLAVGPGKYVPERLLAGLQDARKKCEVRRDDVVYIRYYAGDELTIPGFGKVVIMPESDVLAVEIVAPNEE